MNIRLPLKPTERRLLLLTIDLLVVALAVLASLALWAVRGGYEFGVAFIRARVQWFPLLVLFWVAMATLNGLYDLRRAADLRATAFALLRVTASELGVYVIFYFFSPPARVLPRGIVLYHALLSLSLATLWRAAYRSLSRSTLQRRAVIAGGGRAGRILATRMLAESGSSYSLVGFVDDDPAKEAMSIAGSPVLGTSRDLPDLVRALDIDTVVLAVTYDVQGQLYRALLASQEQGADIIPMPVLYEELTGRVPIEHVGDNWLVALPLEHAAARGFFPILKRGFDIAVSIVGLTLLAILLPLIAVAQHLDCPGPIFYRQERVGRAGRTFRVFKLRSMIPNAEKAGEAVWAQERDPRITRVGRFLRATHLDEFPQFINILKGDMSVVGPRPERPAFVAELEKQVPFYRLRHAVKPGMAGWALVNYGYSSSVEDAMIKVQYDLYYIKHQSLYLDVVILFRTLLDMVTLGGR